jgi:phosphoribosylformimino-5-aminoimidazole carboxamide ribotide isomerase
MHIWPAIDLRGGKCVRLQQGDYRRETVFGEDPVQMAARWRDSGADRLHLVDLDGARDGQGLNQPAVAAIVQSSGLPCQLGGGIRDEETIARWLDQGVQWLVVGTRALKDPDWFRAMCRKYPRRLVLGLDAKEGRVATDGWHEVSERTALEVAAEFDSEPLAAIVYTDIARDGMLQGPNLPAIEQMRARIQIPLIASGGVSGVADIGKLAELDVAGCIVGRALYEGTLTLEEALLAASAAGQALGEAGGSSRPPD